MNLCVLLDDSNNTCKFAQMSLETKCTTSVKLP